MADGTPPATTAKKTASPRNDFITHSLRYAIYFNEYIVREIMGLVNGIAASCGIRYMPTAISMTGMKPSTQPDGDPSLGFLARLIAARPTTATPDTQRR
jgi:hypothetical protein